MFTFDATVSKQWKQPCANLLLWLDSQVGIILSLMSEWQKNHCAVAAFTSADICYVVVLAGDTHKSALQLLISIPGSFAMLSVFLHWHTVLIYSFLLPTTRAVDELGIKPEDSHFSSLTGWTSARRLVCLQAPLMNCCRINRDKLSVFRYPLGHNKTESRPFEKDNITNITLGGGDETRAAN